MSLPGQAVDAELQTSVRRIEYDCTTGVGFVEMDEGRCVDMYGTIALFTRIDPEVQAIHTLAGRNPDTSYFRDAAGQWRAQ